ncbi:MAG: DUF1499 domain-containing protein [Deltaproteobacteria bacterium]|nr:DUF1499 domain-containing protein [Deltaproteobacteria bacterium]
MRPANQGVGSCAFLHAAKLLHVRSASRDGWSDLGVNRRRVHEIRERFETNR